MKILVGGKEVDVKALVTTRVCRYYVTEFHANRVVNGVAYLDFTGVKVTGLNPQNGPYPSLKRFTVYGPNDQEHFS